MSERAIERDVVTLLEAGALIEATPRGYRLRGR
ncbi:MAG: HTH domain-containing protein [Candidatus Eremiobacteraeota bacterium]|nr:HTH domain-containing protein [Candidatus Eremiobacteraeota bacterium]MCW5869250.1 HTH domain-containing protein [Candidatus Eremiobacteraeota bacterium]